MGAQEVYATSGTRLVVRVFGGYDFSTKDSSAPTSQPTATRRRADGRGPQSAGRQGASFLVVARRDRTAQPGRIQVVKAGSTRTASRRRRSTTSPGPGRTKVRASRARMAGCRGRQPVNVAEASYSNSIGAPYLAAYWKDPAFDAKQRAFYCVRVLEIPTRAGRRTTRSSSRWRCRRTCRVDPGARVHFAIWYTPTDGKSLQRASTCNEPAAPARSRAGSRRPRRTRTCRSDSRQRLAARAAIPARLDKPNIVVILADDLGNADLATGAARYARQSMHSPRAACGSSRTTGSNSARPRARRS